MRWNVSNLSIQEASAIVGVSPGMLFKLWRQGDGPPRLRIGKRVLVPTEGLRQWLASRQEQAA
jgi:predicted DNA-binding transcriptional regulator AlpA